MPNAQKRHTAEEIRVIKRRFYGLAFLSLFVISVGTVVIHHLEELTWFDSFYFSIISLSTVGYGDITPQTTGGKIFVIVFLIIGIGVLGATINTMLQNLLVRRQERQYRKK